MEMVSSVPVAQQAMMIMMMSLFSKSSVCFSVCLRMHQNAPNFPGGACPSPLRVNDCRAAMFSTSTIARRCDERTRVYKCVNHR